MTVESDAVVVSFVEAMMGEANGRPTGGGGGGRGSEGAMRAVVVAAAMMIFHGGATMTMAMAAPFVSYRSRVRRVPRVTRLPFECDYFLSKWVTWQMCRYNAYQIPTGCLIEIFSEPALLNQKFRM